MKMLSLKSVAIDRAMLLDVVTYFEFVQTPRVYTDSNVKTTALAVPPFSPSECRQATVHGHRRVPVPAFCELTIQTQN